MQITSGISGPDVVQMNEALIADPVRSRQILERIPAGRWGTPQDFEGAVVFLASKASDYISGECLVVDGGWMGRESAILHSMPAAGVSLMLFRIIAYPSLSHLYLPVMHHLLSHIYNLWAYRNLEPCSLTPCPFPRRTRNRSPTWHHVIRDTRPRFQETHRWESSIIADCTYTPLSLFIAVYF